jgi:hypothetical protein
MPANPSQACGVKRADGCIAGRGAAATEAVIRCSQVRAADLISVAGHSTGDCTKHRLRVNVPGACFSAETAAPAGAAPEKLLCVLVPVQSMPAGCVARHSELVSDSGEGQPSSMPIRRMTRPRSDAPCASGALAHGSRGVASSPRSAWVAIAGS